VKAERAFGIGNQKAEKREKIGIKKGENREKNEGENIKVERRVCECKARMSAISYEKNLFFWVS